MKRKQRRRRLKRVAPTLPVTVVTPALAERGELLAEAIASVQAQTLQPVAHLIAVDHQYAGPAVMMNQLVPAAQTEWIAILADDDLFDPEHLEILAGHVEKADIVMSWGRIAGSPERHQEQHRGEFATVDLVNRRDTGMRGCFMFRRSLYAKLGGWPVGPGEDWQFLHNAALERARFAPVYRETWTYRFHGGNVSEVVAALQRGEKPEQLYHLKHYV